MAFVSLVAFLVIDQKRIIFINNVGLYSLYAFSNYFLEMKINIYGLAITLMNVNFLQHGKTPEMLF